MGHNQSNSEAAQASRAFHQLADTLAGPGPRGINSPREELGHKKLKMIMEAHQKMVGMQLHPNYRKPVPLPGEDVFEFTMRAAGLLISPEQQEGESDELECVDIKAALWAYADELRQIWRVYNNDEVLPRLPK